MRILSINLPPNPDVNLGPIQMGGLGATVVLAGRNGAGKTRLLQQLIAWAGAYVPPGEIETQLAGHRRLLMSARHGNVDRQQIERREKGVSDLERLHSILQAVELSDNRKPVIVPFVPTALGLEDPGNMSPGSMQKWAHAVETPGTNHLPQGTFARIQFLQNRKWEATHPSHTLPGDEVVKAIAEYENLETLVSRFLSTPITRNIDGEAQLFGLSLGQTALSDGQKIILQLCIAIHAQGANLNDMIIFMDVPENHLHPAALLDVVETVQTHLGSGQLWIATHSIPLLANVDSSAIWWMEDSTIAKAGRNPRKVLAGLLGEEERCGKLADFLDLPFALASNRFAAECLLPPGSAAHSPGDPQTQQIRRILERLRPGGDTLRVLDFGAGKGRLASELAEAWTGEERKRLDYIAFDPSSADTEECRAAIARLCGNADERLFHSAAAMRAKHDEGSFHVVLMCNVLHEIPPDDWGDLFGADGKITKLLRTDGYLLLVEVQQLPYGERPHQKGFLVLDTAQLRKLFAITEEESNGKGFAVESQRDGWLKAHLVARSFLERFTSESRRAALTDLASTARDAIRDTLRHEADYRQGRLYGFWIQQFAHAELALRQL